ncbi:MAG TPA: PIN domain-containing protein [Candidatus Nanoarchaeia archaeon]|nr:PIN domain-containing protein [Candidatus Nanoarchaeia archaeon]
MKLLDTSAWVEYFKATQKGTKIKKLIENSVVYTSAISLAELPKWIKENNLDLDWAIDQVKVNSTILSTDESLFIDSGKNYVDLRKLNKKIGLIDTIIYTTAILNHLDLMTTDSDFINLINVEML